MRHGARNPTAAALKRILASLTEVEGKASSDPALDFVKTFTYNTSQADLLTDFGRHEVYLAGVRYAEEYKDLGSDVFTRADSDKRVVESGGWFLQGFKGETFNLNATLDMPDVVSASSDS